MKYTETGRGAGYLEERSLLEREKHRAVMQAKSKRLAELGFRPPELGPQGSWGGSNADTKQKGKLELLGDCPLPSGFLPWWLTVSHLHSIVFTSGMKGLEKNSELEMNSYLDDLTMQCVPHTQWLEPSQ